MEKIAAIIFHIDVNSAFLSWESLYRMERGVENADLRNIPAIIGGRQEDRHGIVLAKSTIAKKYGIRTGEPITQAINKCPDILIVHPHHNEYVKRSKKFITLLQQYTDTLQQVSIDEAYLDMTAITECQKSPVSFADNIRKNIYNSLGFTVNIGIAENKLLAKMASDFEKPDKTHTLWKDEIPEKMWPLPVGELFLVGRSAKNTLSKLGISTIGELAAMDKELLISHLGNKYGTTIHNYANGIDTEKVEEPEVKNKGIGNSVTLPSDVTDFETANQVLLSLAETVGARLRNEGYLSSNISVEIKDWDFKRTSHQTMLTDATDSTGEIYSIACRLLKEHWDNTPLRLLGIRASKLSTHQYRQLSIFDTPVSEKQKKLDSAIDSIRNRFGKNAIKRASFLDSDSVTDQKRDKKTP